MDARIHSTEVRTRIISNALAEARQPTGIDEVLLIVLLPDAHTYIREGVSGFDNVPVRTFTFKKRDKLQNVFTSIQTSMQEQLFFQHIGFGVPPALLKNLTLALMQTMMARDEALIFTTTLNLWPVTHRFSIAVAIAQKLTDLNHKVVPFSKVQEQLSMNPSYAALLDWIKPRYLYGEYLTIASYLACHEQVPDPTKHHLRHLISEANILAGATSEGNSACQDKRKDKTVIRQNEASSTMKSPNPHDVANELITRPPPDLKQLEEQVEACMKMLGRLEGPLQQFTTNNKDVAQWLQQIDELYQLTTIAPTIIGVVGNTGAGKSSVINAILDEERLVPTNCMRACTAVVTEMSWNKSDNEQEKYRAEIEFISKADWEKELSILFQEMVDSKGRLSNECYSAETEAAVAYAKIRAVYPHKTNAMLASSSPEELLQEDGLQAILESTKTLSSAHADSFYDDLQKYVDSAQKSDNETTKTQYWPLIKLVRIYTKSDALSTGAVIVDLPGVHDSNAARSAVASNYMKQCTGLFIVAPINRAVDDKAAKSLLGESFKRQLKYDGTYSRVTFICSKTDDISLSEASESLGLVEQTRECWKQLDALSNDRKSLDNEQKDLKKSVKDHAAIADAIDEELEIWEMLRANFENGSTVFAPSKKRKRSQSSNVPRQKQVPNGTADEEEDLDSDEEGYESPDPLEETEPEEQAHTTGPLTAEDIEGKLQALKDDKKQNRALKSQLSAKISAISKKLKENRSKKAEIDAELSNVCISGRNAYSKGAIRQDFAAGIKELDQENRLEEDEDNFDPEDDMRDYSEVARSLPVFCVSSRAYQKLSGRLLRDSSVKGFTSMEQTEIPQLQAHCKELTVAGRAHGCKRVLDKYVQFINSVTLWIDKKTTTFQLTAAEQRVEAIYMESQLKVLGGELKNAVKDSSNAIKVNLASRLYCKFEPVIAAATAEAYTTVLSWGVARDRDDVSKGGLPWATYKAVVRRSGTYSNSHRQIDFNSQLAEPFMIKLSNDWERCFSQHLPGEISKFSKTAIGLLQAFHFKILEHGKARSAPIVGFHDTLADQLSLYGSDITNLTRIVSEAMNKHQRDANRSFVPAIAASLSAVYRRCANDTGPGSFKRIKGYMQEHIEMQKSTMFNKAIDRVKAELDRMCIELEKSMLKETNAIFRLMRQDYFAVITSPKKWTHSERALRTQIGHILKDTEVIAKSSVSIKDSEPGASIKFEDTIMDGISDPAAQAAVHSSITTTTSSTERLVAKETSSSNASPSHRVVEHPKTPEPLESRRQMLQNIQPDTGTGISPSLAYLALVNNLDSSTPAGRSFAAAHQDDENISDSAKASSKVRAPLPTLENKSCFK